MNLQGAIIAAGSGERLKKSGATALPKPLVEVGGRPLLVRQACAMLTAGADSVVAVINSETAQLARELKLPRELRLIVRDTANSMESLLALRNEISEPRFLLATVDAIVPDRELTRFVDAALKTSPRTPLPPEEGNTTPPETFDGLLAVTRWNGEKQALFADVTKSGLIAGLGEQETKFITAGFYLMPSSIFGLAGRAHELRLNALRRFLAMLIDQGLRLGAIEVKDAIDVDEAADLAVARRLLKSSVGEKVNREGDDR